MTAPPRVRAIIAQVAADHGTTTEAIVGRDRRRACAWPRHAAMAAVRDAVIILGQPVSYSIIGRWFDRDHSTVMAGVRAHRERVGA